MKLMQDSASVGWTSGGMLDMWYDDQESEEGGLFVIFRIFKSILFFVN